MVVGSAQLLDRLLGFVLHLCGGRAALYRRQRVKDGPLFLLLLRVEDTNVQRNLQVGMLGHFFGHLTAIFHDGLVIDFRRDQSLLFQLLDRIFPELFRLSHMVSICALLYSSVGASWNRSR